MNTTAPAIHHFSLVKGGESYVVRCSPGNEEEAIGLLMQWAENKDLNFDWFDAAVISRQITQRLFCRAVSGETSES